MHACDGDIINIDGTGTSRDPYPCQNEKGLDLAGLVLRSYNSRAFISCRTNGFRFFCGMASRGVFLEEITFVNTSIHLFECSLNAVACSFINSSVPTLTLKYDEYLMMRNVQLNGCTFQNNSASSVTIYGNSSVDLNVSNSTFVSNKIRSEGDAILNMSIQNLQANQSSIKANFTDLRVSHNNCSGQACFRVFAGINGTDLVLVMERVLFENNVAEVNILDVHGFSNGYTAFKSTQFRKNTGRAVKIHNGNSIDLKIETSIFSGNGIPYSRIKPEWNYDESNGGAVLVDGFTQDALVSLHGSKFNSNKGGSGGACAFVNILRSLLVDIKNCRFVRNEGRFSGGAVAVGSFSKWLYYSDWICIHSSEFSGNKLLRNACGSDTVCGGGAVALYMLHMGNLSIVNDTFTDNRVEGKSSGAIYGEGDRLYSDVEILNCEFFRNWASEYTSTLALHFRKSSQPRVTLQNLTFIKNSRDVNNSLITSVTSDILINPGNGYVVLRSCKIKKNSGGGIQVDLTPYERHLGSNVSFVMENTLISENIFFLMTIGIDEQAFQPVYHLKNVSFVNNNCYAGHDLNCINLRALHSNCSFHLEQSTFLNNFGFSGVIRIVSSPPAISNTKFRTIITNSEFRNNSGGDKCILELLNVYATEIQNCNFTDNFGGVGSSHIRIFSGKLTIWNNTFNQSAESQVLYNVGGKSKDFVAFNGFLAVTQSEIVEIRNSSFILDPFSTDSKAIVVVEGAGKGILDNSVQIESPVNTKLNMRRLQTHNYHEGVTEELVWISTERCPVGTYSIRRGKQSGYSVEELVKCFPCPVGGNCSSSLAAQPNFWGYPVNNDTVTFQLCPEGYCCLPSVDNKCSYYNNSYLHSGCQGNRTGILCGQCKQHFIEGLFTTECVRAKDCTHYWYWAVFVALTISFAFYLVKKNPVFEAVGEQLTWFIPRRAEDNDQVIGSPNNTVRESVSPNYGFLKIIFYFYQVAGVLTVSSYGVKNLLRNEIVLPITNLLNLKLYANTNWKICPWNKIGPHLKPVLPLLTVMTILFWIPVIYLVHIVVNKLCKRGPTFPPAGPYFGAVLETVLLGYSAATGTIVRLLHCVRIQEEHRWYHNAQYVCYQWWQFTAFFVFGVLFLFITTLYSTSLQLFRGKISPKIFLLVSILPFLYLFFLLYQYVKKKKTKRADYQAVPSTAGSVHEEERDTNSSMNIEASLPEEKGIPSIAGSVHEEERDTNSSTSIRASLLEVLCGPFTKPQGDQSNGRIYWESILIGRRFLIIVSGCFLSEYALLRSVFLTILCLIYLVVHIYMKPFAQCRANITETVSLATLVVIGVLNVGLASARSDVSGINQRHVSILLTLEAVLLGVLTTFFILHILWKATRARCLIFKRKYDTRLSVQGGDESQPPPPRSL